MMAITTASVASAATYTSSTSTKVSIVNGVTKVENNNPNVKVDTSKQGCVTTSSSTGGSVTKPNVADTIAQAKKKAEAARKSSVARSNAADIIAQAKEKADTARKNSVTKK